MRALVLSNSCHCRTPTCSYCFAPSASFIKLGVWAVYGVADVASRVSACMFRQEHICTVLVSKIVFLQELGPEVGLSGLKCDRSVLGRCCCAMVGVLMGQWTEMGR